MSDATAYLRQLEDKLLSTDPQDVETVELLKSEHQRVSSSIAAAKPRATPPDAAAGAPDRGGSTGTGGDLATPREVALRTATAPAKGLAGLADTAYHVGTWPLRKLGLMDESSMEPDLTPQVDKLRTALMGGKPMHDSVLSQAYEGAVTAPLSGAKSIPAFVSGAAGGASAEGAKEAGAGPWTQVAAGLAGGVGAGKLATNRNLTLEEALAKSRLNKATEGLTSEDFRSGQGALDAAKIEGVGLLPSQSLDVPAPGLLDLQTALLNSKAGKADALRTDVAQQPKDVKLLADRLQKMSGQNSRSDDLLAGEVQGVAKKALKAEGDAVNAATRPLYNAEDAVKPFSPLYTKYRADQLEKVIDEAIATHRAEPLSVAALADTKQRIVGLLRDPNGNVTPAELQKIISFAKSDLPTYSEMSPSLGNLARQRVGDALSFLEGRVDAMAPSVAKATAMQRELRGNMSNTFSEVSKQAKANGAAESVLMGVEKRPEVVAEVAKANPQLAQELLQRQVDRAVDKAFATSPNTGLAPSNAGITMKSALSEGLAGKAFDKNLELMFPGRPDAAEGFRRILSVAANASKPRSNGGTSGAGWAPSASEEAVRAGAGSLGQKVGVVSRLTGGVFGKLRDNASLSVLQRPDVMARLEMLATMPQPKLTPAAIMATVPQLFEEQEQ